ncbi:MAG: tyrosine-type recombinase/integrase [Candidatus Dormibacterales bacterium]
MASPKLKIVEKRVSALEQLVADYLAHQRGRGLSSRSTALTANVLEHRWLPWCAKAEITAPEQLEQRVLDRWSAYLLEDHRTPAGKPLARESVRTYLRTLGTFIRWAQSEDAVGAKVKARQPLAEHRLVETLSREEIQLMEDEASSVRDKLMIRVLADTGIRLGELLGLRAADLQEHGRDRFIKVRGKGARERLVPLQPSLFMRLRKYAERGRAASPRDRIFVTTKRSPKTGEYEPLAPRSVQNMIKFTARDAGIERAVHPHLFRHSFATWALRKGMNPVQLQRILGHADLSMISSVYSHLTPSDAYSAMLELVRAENGDA